MARTHSCLSLLALVLFPVQPVSAALIEVGPGVSIQAAIDAAADGDVIRAAPGVYEGDVDFGGKAVALVGAGPDSVLRGSGTGSVVRFTSGEGPGSVLDSFTVTGGVATQGGGIQVVDSSPTIVRNVVRGNRAVSAGSGIMLLRSRAAVYNNLILDNRSAGGDPHGVEVSASAAEIVNNTIFGGDSNGIILRGDSPAMVRNNVIARNGSSPDRFDVRGRGICDFSGGRARIQYNLFHRNRIGALLTDGTDFRRARRAERLIAPPRLLGNLDGSPGFAMRFPLSDAGAPAAAFRLRPRSRARDGGDPDAAYADADGSRNDIGFTGGPLAPSWLQP